MVIIKINQTSLLLKMDRFKELRQKILFGINGLNECQMYTLARYSVMLYT